MWRREGTYRYIHTVKDRRIWMVRIRCDKKSLSKVCHLPDPSPCTRQRLIVQERVSWWKLEGLNVRYIGFDGNVLVYADNPVKQSGISIYHKNIKQYFLLREEHWPLFRARSANVYMATRNQSISWRCLLNVQRRLVLKPIWILFGAWLDVNLVHLHPLSGGMV